YVARYNRDGTADATFNGTGRRMFGDATSGTGLYAALPLADGHILAAGTAYVPATDRSHGEVLKLQADGSDDASFGAGGRVAITPQNSHSAYAMHLVRDADGRIVVAGFELDADAMNPIGFVARLSANGQPDQSFGPAGFRSLG